jgi:hypothetical protein
MSEHDEPLESIREAEMGRLALYRRLWHHLNHGGKTTEHDDRRCGFPVTKEALEREIRTLEARTHG